MTTDPDAAIETPDARRTRNGESAVHRDLRAMQCVAGLLRQKWSPAILLVLADGPHSYTSLVRKANAMPVEGHLSPKTATATTRSLRDQGLVTITRATSETRFHTSSTYALTAHGHALVAELRKRLGFLAQVRSPS